MSVAQIKNIHTKNNSLYIFLVPNNSEDAISVLVNRDRRDLLLKLPEKQTGMHQIQSTFQHISLLFVLYSVFFNFCLFSNSSTKAAARLMRPAAWAEQRSVYTENAINSGSIGISQGFAVLSESEARRVKPAAETRSLRQRWLGTQTRLLQQSIT